MSNKVGLRLPPEQRRRQIVEVAARSFARVGHENASMAEIAAEAGVTRALVYHYFSSKEALLEAVLRLEGEALLEATKPVLGRTLREMLESALGAYLSHFAASAGEVRDLYAPTQLSPTVVWEIAAANHEVQVSRLMTLAGQEDSAQVRLTLSAWLSFVETAARSAAVEPDISGRTVIDLCTAAFEAVVDLSLDEPIPASSNHQQKDTS